MKHKITGQDQKDIIKSFGKADRWIALALLMIVLIVQIQGPRAFPEDTAWYVPTAMSIISEHNTDLDEYRALVGPRSWAVGIYEGHTYNCFPLGTSLFAVPFVWLFDLIAQYVLLIDLRALMQTGPALGMQIFIAAASVALTTVVVYALGRETLSVPRSVALALCFAFGTSAWSTASRVLWQHGPSMLMLALALALIRRAERQPSYLLPLGMVLGFSYLVRPTNAISLVVLGAYALLRHRSWAGLYMLGVACVLTPFFLYNTSVHQSLLPRYYQPGRLRLHSSFLEALAGNLISPARGLFVFTPITLFSFLGLALSVRRSPRNLLNYALALIFGLHLVTVSAFPHWWAGGSIGPRFFSDMTPYLFFFLIPILEGSSQQNRARRITLWTVLALTATLGIAIHAKSSLDPDVQRWNNWPRDVDRYPERLWDWGDVQFLRGIQVIAPTTTPLPRWNGWFLPNRSHVVFGETFLLRGYEVEKLSIDSYSVVLYWQALATSDLDYSVFVHAVDGAGTLITQKDHPPGSRLGYPPTKWRKGDLIYDEHLLHFPAGTVGTARLQVGLYDWRTGQRLAAAIDGAPAGDAIQLSEGIHIPQTRWERHLFPLLIQGAHPG